ncbi:ABC transporter substrate-binding protein [Rathayibacter soli]|uniref:ABC transporter substrate-binding protein n=1 Tax=Rathayibacter soli TaxID=3144168 RepID=UPI0027E4DCAE|nr:ABC transporter substrate-binding protein [Glaciibacter superstes]
MFKTRRAIAVLSVATAAALVLSACGSGSGSSSTTSGPAVNPATATSAADFGGMAQLVAAAKKEGTLNVIALPDSWANYGKIIAAFKSKYGLTVNSANPNGSSADEIKAADDNKGQDTAPDVFDLGAAVALASTAKFAPYKVANWKDIPAANKEATGLWVNDYTGSMSIGYNSAKYPRPTSLDDLLKPAFKGGVALNGDPTQAGAAFAGVALATVQSGGTLDNFQPGIDFFNKLNKAGNFLTVDPTPATIASGETGVVFDWSYNNLAAAATVPGWKVTTLPGTAYISYYNQAINKDAPHPAAARLWQEFIFSPTAQNLFLAAGAYPVTIDAMTSAGTVDKTALDSVGALPKNRVSATTDQTNAANALLSKNWAAAIGQ